MINLLPGLVAWAGSNIPDGYEQVFVKERYLPIYDIPIETESGDIVTEMRKGIWLKEAEKPFEVCLNLDELLLP